VPYAVLCCLLCLHGIAECLLLSCCAAFCAVLFALLCCELPRPSCGMASRDARDAVWCDPMRCDA
jgi:hypothetical protein